MNLALSTSWNAFEFSGGSKIVSQIKDLGFDTIELSFSLNTQIIDDISALVKNKKIQVISLHNFCPVPEGVARDVALPDFYSLASTKEEERKRAVYFTKKSIDTCRKLNAQAVVLHCGRVDIEDTTRRLIDLYHQDKKETIGFTKLKEAMQEARRDKENIYLNRAITSLEELAEYAKGLNVKLGLENRFYFPEIPNIDEFDKIFEKVNSDNIFYWHDTGHARVMRNLGFVDSEYTYLERYKDRLLGIHLHDVRGCDDHLAPLEGKLDFSSFEPYLSGSTLKVIEAHHPATAASIIKAKNYLEKILCSERRQ